MRLKDSSQRSQATDPTKSFIVQAPAGSGKTELLTQRYLRLLGTVKEPEQIVALTFTRKAANEMRERILKSLQLAASNFEPTSAHQQQTLEIAQQALKQDKANQWQLLNQPSRLRIITIDALCQTIAHAIPLQDKQVPYAQISDKANIHYQAAAQACLAFAIENQEYQKPIQTLLKHLDNHQNKLLDLFVQLLATRTQWLQPIFQARIQEKEQFEYALKIIEQHELTRFMQSVPQDIQEELTKLARQVAIIEANPDSPRYSLCDWQSFASLDSNYAASLATLLLTSQNSLRKSFDHHVGLKRDRCDEYEYNNIKEASKNLFEKLNQLPDFVDALLRVKKLPDPHYNKEQWNTLQALFTIIPLLIAHLNLIFNTHNEVDFTSVSQQASDALGDDDCPTDLALYLDNAIHHLLVDEFQDTSIQQFDLLAKLVQGWQTDDGRTLFVVGDPMQSIYRFRSAEVGLFLRAQQHGIGLVKLTTLELSTNFRSTQTIVDWVNSQFQLIFPQQDDIESGAVTFHPSTYTQTTENDSLVHALQYETSEQEAQGIGDIISEELQNKPNDTIAILVRSRSQLTKIISILRAREIPFQGVEIDLLANLPHLRDVWSLTQALLMPANRLAWLSLLRSPWCGLSIADLHQIANFAPKKSLLFALSQLEKIAGISTEGCIRAKFIYEILSETLRNRYQQSLIDSLVNTLKRLHLERILNKTEQDDLEQYWKLLSRFEHAGQLDNLGQFKDEFITLYSQQVTPSRLQIMTIHKSKGLEFDCVILPGLSKRPPNPATPLLRWLKLPQETNDDLLLISPIKAAHQEQCKVYDFLGKLDVQKSYYEMQRLLYVAATRAKKRLYLTDHSKTKSTNSFRGLLKKQEFMVQKSEEIATDYSAISLPKIHHLPTQFYEINPLNKKQQPVPSIISLNDNIARLTGIITHELLQWICTNHPQTLEEIPWTLAQNQMLAMGFTSKQNINTLSLLKSWFNELFNDSIGKWIIQAHENELNEYEIIIKEQNEIKTRIIDRTFCEKETRWIIDFKTGSEDQNAINNHRQQVNDYAKHLSNLYHQPIQCGLYFLATNNWISWKYSL